MATLEIKHLSCTQLSHVELALTAGECVCLAGASGSGKSSLLRAVADLDPHEGEVRLDGQLQQSMPAHEWRRRVGLLSAESQWWFDDVGAHFTQPELSWFERLGFDEDVLGWQVSRLSSGEKQRLALLRLMCGRPEVLLLDEASANLDEQNTAVVEGLINEYRRECQAPVLWVSHDLAQVERLADRFYRIEQGALVEQ